MKQFLYPSTKNVTGLIINNDLSQLDITAVCRLQGELKSEFMKQLGILQNKLVEIKEKIENGIN